MARRPSQVDVLPLAPRRTKSPEKRGLTPRQFSPQAKGSANDGRSFPFRGHLDLAALAKRNLGPTTLRERIMALGGDMAVDSRTGGARLEIRLPLLMEGVANAD